MNKLGTLFALVLAGCGLHDTWSNRVEPYDLGPVPPDHVLRRPADFRLFDPHVRKEFFLYLYEDESGKFDFVTVINYALPEGVRTKRLATREEFDYAMALFQADWRSRGDEQKLRYFNDRHREEMQRRSTLLDHQIVLKRAEVRDWEEQVLALESDSLSRKETGTFASGDEKLSLQDSPALERQLARARRRLAVSEGQLFLLEYYRALRDAQYARVLEVYVDTSFRVSDLVPAHLSGEKLVADIRVGIHSWAWQRPSARISFSEGQLHVRQTRDILIHVRDHLEWLRDQAIARRAKADELKSPKDAAPK